MPELRKALPVHHTPTSDGAWDGPKAKANLRNDETAAYYKKAFAWVDPDGDPDVKASYKFIHHEVSSDGTIGAANLRACSSSIGILNGGRGGANIPSEDKKPVWNHVAAHIRDADMEPPELKASKPPMVERRMFPVELRVQTDDGVKKIVGHAGVFNQLSENLGGFREKVAPGAFAKTIQEADIRALWNHNIDIVLGRNRANTLSLEEDDKGLAFRILPPKWADNYCETIDRGDVSQMSFAFRTIRDEWQNEEGKESLRILHEVELFDVSPVTYPAYPQTDVNVRAVFREAGLDFEALAAVLVRVEHGLPLFERDIELINTSVGVLSSHLPKEPGPDPHSEEHGEVKPSLLILRKRLEIAEKAV